MHSLNVRRLSKRYWLGNRHKRELWALRDVSFTVDRGEILGIIGPNGAGKTTLLKVLSRVTPPTEGRVVGLGRVVPLLALGTGFQPEVSGRENIYLNAAIYGVSASDVEAQMDEIIDFADIGEFIDVPVKKYSSGMYLRLAFSVAINMNPDILLADEVLAVGDIDFQERCLERVKQAGRAGMSVLFVSHDMAAITRLCDRVLWLNAGEIVRVGDPEEVVTEYQSASWSKMGRRLKDSRSGGHKSAVAEIRYVSLTTVDGREVGAVRAEDEIFVRIGIRVKQPDVQVSCMITVQAQGTLVFRAPSTPFASPAVGPHIVSMRIPPSVFAETIYTLSVDLSLVTPDGTRSAVSAFNAVSFQVFKTTGGRKDRLAGVVSPAVSWSLEAAETGDQTQPDAEPVVTKR